MKLHENLSASLNTVTAYGEDYVDINGHRYTNSVIVRPAGAVIQWPVNAFAALDSEHFKQILAAFSSSFSQNSQQGQERQAGIEVVILGTGKKLRFPPPSVMTPLTSHQIGHRMGIGIEVMDVQAACRTYNILMAEGRKVVAALLIE